MPAFPTAERKEALVKGVAELVDVIVLQQVTRRCKASPPAKMQGMPTVMGVCRVHDGIHERICGNFQGSNGFIRNHWDSSFHMFPYIADFQISTIVNGFICLHIQGSRTIAMLQDRKSRPR